MQLVLPLSRMAEAAPYMDPKVFRYIHEGQTESFESFETFNLLAFNWYDIHSDRTDDSKVLIYMDRKDLFFLCEDAEASTSSGRISKIWPTQRPREMRN